MDVIKIIIYIYYFPPSFLIFGNCFECQNNLKNTGLDLQRISPPIISFLPIYLKLVDDINTKSSIFEEQNKIGGKYKCNSLLITQIKSNSIFIKRINIYTYLQYERIVTN